LFLEEEEEEEEEQQQQQQHKIITIKLLLLLLLLHNIDVSCHRSFLPDASLQSAVNPTAQASSFTLQYFPYYV